MTPTRFNTAQLLATTRGLCTAMWRHNANDVIALSTTVDLSCVVGVNRPLENRIGDCGVSRCFVTIIRRVESYVYVLSPKSIRLIVRSAVVLRVGPLKNFLRFRLPSVPRKNLRHSLKFSVDLRIFWQFLACSQLLLEKNLFIPSFTLQCLDFLSVLRDTIAVSYTHLTLPTILRV